MIGTDARVVQEFVTTLTRTQRLLLMLHYAEGLNTLEISQVLDLPEPRVRSMLADVRRRAQCELAPAAAADERRSPEDPPD